MVGDSYSVFGYNFFLEEEFLQDLLGRPARGDRGGESPGGGVASGRAAKSRLVTPSRHSNGPSTNG